MSTKKIALDAGHGLYTSGKQTLPDPKTGIITKEWTLNDKVRDKVVAILSDYDCDIIYLDNNEGKEDEHLADRLNKYKNAKIDAMVSIHHNAFTNSWNTATGVETWTDLNPTSKDMALAKAIHKNLAKYTGLADRGIKQENWWVINQNKVPAVLVEGGFMDSKIDYPVITSDAGQTAYAKAVAEGLIEFLNLEKKNDSFIGNLFNVFGKNKTNEVSSDETDDNSSFYNNADSKSYNKTSNNVTSSNNDTSSDGSKNVSTDGSKNTPSDNNTPPSNKQKKTPDALKTRHKCTIQFKRGTSEDWEKNKYLVLEAGQPGYNITTNKLKIGNGEDSWEDLEYLNGGFSFFNYDSTSNSDDGDFYIKEYDGDVESDYVVEGPTRNKNYCYRKWASGFIECWGEGTEIPDLSSLVKETIFELQSGKYFEIKGF